MSIVMNELEKYLIPVINDIIYQYYGLFEESKQELKKNKYEYEKIRNEFKIMKIKRSDMIKKYMKYSNDLSYLSEYLYLIYSRGVYVYNITTGVFRYSYDYVDLNNGICIPSNEMNEILNELTGRKFIHKDKEYFSYSMTNIYVLEGDL